MKKQKLLPLVATVVMFASVHAFPGDVKIIANPSIKAEGISASELKSVFLKERNSLRDGTRVEPVLLKEGPAHEAFLKDYLGKTDEALQTSYSTLVFTGKGLMPKTLHSDDDVVAYVAKTRGAIGYVSSNVAMDGVKTLAVYPPGNDGVRTLISRVEPVYPVILLSNHIGGTVRVKVTIAQNGTVRDVELMGGNPVLGEAAMTAVRKWVYAIGRSQTTTEVSIPFDASR